jgi:hypothetical protein
VSVDESVVPPRSLAEDVRRLVADEFADTMFFDDSKRAMISVEQRVDVANEDYLAAQPRFDEAAFRLVASRGLGVHQGDQVAPDVNGEVPWQLDPSIIASDIQSEKLTKDRAVGRALDYFRSLGPLPRRWRSVGDSRGDYRMADRLHADGFEVAHVDVRPDDGVPDTHYEVITPEGVNDEAGARFLRDTVRELGLG